MRDIIPALLAALERGQPVAYCRLVETRGSTPQKAGATMLVYPDGTQAGTLGGGCVEAEAKRRAIGVLHEGQATVSTFQLDNDYGWDDGLICGGRMRVLIEPITGTEAREYFEQLVRLTNSGGGATESVVFDAESSGLVAPSMYLFDGHDRPVAALRPESTNGAPPPLVVELLKPLATRPRPYAAKGIAYLPVVPRCRLLIVGGGHVGKAVADLAAELDFEVWVMDDREEFVSPERFPKAERRVHGPVDDVLPNIEVTADTFCLIVTRGHSHDEQALYHLIDRGARYVGMIGSRRKIKLIFEDLLQEGVSPELLRRVHAPVGLDIGSQTVPEIAVSICAELVAFRNTGSAGIQAHREQIAIEDLPPVGGSTT